MIICNILACQNENFDPLPHFYDKNNQWHLNSHIILYRKLIVSWNFITKEKVHILKEADFIFIDELKNSNHYNTIWQAYAALLPVKTVGVMGDNRTYEYTCLLRAVTSEDGMTADFFYFDKHFLQKISNRIINSVKGINRVVYDITSKPPSTIELE